MHRLSSVCSKLAGLGLLLLAGASQHAQADVIRLNDGTVIDGQVIRDDDTAVIIVVKGQPQFYPAVDVSAILYNKPFIDVLPRQGRSSATQALTDQSIVDKIRERLLTFHGFVLRTASAAEYLRWSQIKRAGRAFQRAAQWILPTHRGYFSPFSALADLLILLGLRAPTLWLALAFIRERRQFLRITEFFVPSYGLLMLLMLYVSLADAVWIQVVLFPLAIFAIALLFMWMFVLTPGRTLLAFMIAVAMNAGLEALLVRSNWLSAGLTSAFLQLAQR